MTNYDPSKNTPNPPDMTIEEASRRAIFITIRPDGSCMWDYHESVLKKRLDEEGWR